MNKLLKLKIKISEIDALIEKRNYGCCALFKLEK